MFKNIIFISTLVFVAGCDSSNALKGIATLGPDFVRAFNQDAKDTPLDASALRLNLTPKREPFNP